MQLHGVPLFDARLLVAEDNQDNQDIAARILENMGCRVVVANNGAVAERLLAQDKFDLVLMDCEMPELDGFDVTRRFRLVEGPADPDRKTAGGRIPIIALTAHAADDIRQKCLAAGMDDVLVKPFKKAQIGEVLRHWIGNLEKSGARQEQPGCSQGSGTNPARHEAPADSAIDRGVLDDFLASKGDGGIILVRRLLSRFMETAPSLIASLREKYEARQPEELWRLAHSIRSSAAALGIRQLADRLAEIEKSARDCKLENLQPMLVSLESDLADALRGLHHLKGELDARAR